MRLIVSVTGTPGTAPSAPSRTASITAANSDALANGRAASCTQMTVASGGTAPSPARTDALRVSPPATADSRAASCGGTTTTTPSLAARAALTARSMIRSPPIVSYCFGPPKRIPRPAPTTTVHTTSSSG